MAIRDQRLGKREGVVHGQTSRAPRGRAASSRMALVPMLWNLISCSLK
jgi:hypothetical protein